MGKVQGVFYRKSSAEKAVSLNIQGWVRNCDDGSVEIWAEGEEEALKIFLIWCKTGPKNAVVSGVKESQVDLAGYSDFRIIR